MPAHTCISFPPSFRTLPPFRDFVTAYTPYQPEISQGTLQSLFEFQSFMVELTDMELANCSMYDGASSTAEAMLMAHRIKKADRVLIAATVNPMYVATVRTYLEPHGITVDVVRMDDRGQVSMEDLESQLSASACSAVLVQSPNYLGIVEDLGMIGTTVHAHDALFVESFTEAMALGLLKYGVGTGADVVVGEGQSLGLSMSFGGPHLGVFATLKKYNRDFPGRIVGESIDTKGRQAFVMTLRAREQDIRREKATSNICSNHALNALTAAVYLGCVGESGFRALACENAAKLKKLIKGLETHWATSPVFSSRARCSTKQSWPVRSLLRTCGRAWPACRCSLHSLLLVMLPRRFRGCLTHIWSARPRCSRTVSLNRFSAH